MIRKAVAADRDRVLAMAKAFHAVSGHPFAFSAPMADMLFQAALVDPDRFCLILEEDGRAVGVLAAHAAMHLLAPVKIAQEIIWWIEPGHRGRSGLAMLNAYETWAKGRGCVLIHMVGLGSEPATTKLYERCGYEAAERHFMKPLSA